MTSKERVQMAIARAQPDRVPVDYYARAEVTAQLAQHLKLKPGEWVEERLGVDLRGVGPAFKASVSPLCYADPTVEVTPEGIYRDIWGVGFKRNETRVGSYMELATSPLRGPRLRRTGGLPLAHRRPMGLLHHCRAGRGERRLLGVGAQPGHL